jgi:transcriptional regulator with XRE-family HTH domain
MSYAQGAETSVAFRAYMQRFGLSVRDVAVVANVRLLTVWKIEQGLPIREADVLAVCAALYHLTGVTFTTLIPIIPAEILLPAQASRRENKP